MARQQRTTPQRGYGYRHQKERERWRPEVEAGRAWCHAAICLKPSRWIAPGTLWHLGHTPDRLSWTGPEHAVCNVTDGARRGGLARTRARRYASQPQPGTGWLTSRDW